MTPTITAILIAAVIIVFVTFIITYYLMIFQGAHQTSSKARVPLFVNSAVMMLALLAILVILIASLA